MISVFDYEEFILRGLRTNEKKGKSSSFCFRLHDAAREGELRWNTVQVQQVLSAVQLGLGTDLSRQGGGSHRERLLRHHTL